MTLYDIAVALVAVAAGAIAAVAGFGIGSLVTPALAVSLGTKVAVTVVAIPHAVATAYRLWLLRRDVDRSVLLGFGLASAAGGLTGAVVRGFISSPILAIVLGALLVLAGTLELTRLAGRLLLVDVVRLPVYVATGWSDLVDNWPMVVVLTLAVLIGTVVGAPILRRLPAQQFRRILAVLLIGLGVLLIVGIRS